MASSWLSFFTPTFLLLLLLLFLHVAESSSASSRCFTTIYSFGDSIADTGNLYFDDNTDNHIPATQALVLNLPYGETYFHRPTGRCSDGRLIIDFFAEQMGIPLLKPYLEIKNGELRDYWKRRREGVNFAVAGATALDPSFFLDKGINDIQTNYSLSVQLDWFMDLLPSICTNSSSSSGCKEVLGKSLFFVGEIGGNDINHPLFKDTSADEIIRTYVPNVINEISSTINKLIEVGAQTLVVPGNFPLGCSFFYLTKYHTTDMDEYDQAGCLKWLNKLAEYYNHKLYNELNCLRALHPDTNIIYADYYHASLRLYQSPTLFGFTKSTEDACCVAKYDGKNTYDPSVRCGDPEVIACDDPSQYISWDSIHLTEAAYKWIAKSLLTGLYTKPKISFSCDSEI